MSAVLPGPTRRCHRDRPHQPPAARRRSALTDWQAAKLVKPTWFKPLVATLSLNIVVRRLGSLADRTRLARVLDMLVDQSLKNSRR